MEILTQHIHGRVSPCRSHIHVCSKKWWACQFLYQTHCWSKSLN